MRIARIAVLAVSALWVAGIWPALAQTPASKTQPAAAPAAKTQPAQKGQPAASPQKTAAPAPATPASKAPAAQTKPSALKPAATGTKAAPQKTAKAPEKPKAAPKKAEPKKAEAMPQQVPAAKPAQKVVQADARRDPFKSVIVEQKPGIEATPTCPQGVRGLLIGQIEVNGVARTPGGFIGVVTTKGDRTWFLRDNQPLCNGRVAQITADSVIFEENIIDPLGKLGKREVIKKIPAEAK